MSGNDEPMDWTSSQTPSGDTSAENQDKVQVTLSLKWFESPPPSNKNLIKALQSWGNSRKSPKTCDDLDVRDNNMAKITIWPAPDLSDLQDLCGKTLTLTRKKKDGKDETIAKILSVILSPQESEAETENASEPQNGAGPYEHCDDMSTDVPPQPEIQSAEDTSNTPLSSSGPKSCDEQPVEQSSPISPAAVSAAGESTETGILPVSQFMYTNNIYKKEIENIEKKNGVKMEANTLVKFSAVEENGNLRAALEEFTDLVQKVDCCGSNFTLKNKDPKEIMDALQIVLTKESKLLFTLSSEEMTISGPSQYQDTIKKLLETKGIYSSAEKSVATPQDTPPNIDMSITDPFLTPGLIFEENQWKLMKTSFQQELKKIEAKFGVDINVVEDGQGKVNIKTSYKRFGGNASMESHALRALLRLYQKITTSLLNFTRPHGASGFNGSLKNYSDVDEPEGATGGSGLNSKRGYNISYPDAPREEKATAGDKEEETCPICMDTFSKKTQLKCKHEFCEGCLEKAKENMGPMCPVCKDVFGKIEGDQPPGEMNWNFCLQSLKGFPNCGHILITYDIPSGRQTEKHPHPGKYYNGIRRTAYLPDNKEGNEVLRLLKKAFDQKLIFTVGTSRTTGAENQVTWNDIHHKTSMTGGATGFGYPDPDYLSRVKEELKSKGIE